MIDKLTTLFTGSHKFLVPLHHHDPNTSNEDVIVVVTDPYESIYYIVVDNRYNTVLVRKALHCTSRIKKTVTDVFPSITISELSINAIFGVYTCINSRPVTTIFVVLISSHSRRKFLVQIDILDNNTKELRVTGITEYFDNYHQYFDTLVTANVIVTDYSTTKNTDVYITYVPLTYSGELASLDIEGIQVLVTEEDKNDFTSRTGIELTQQIYPIVDTWSTINRKFFKLTADTAKIKLNFSTGVGFIGFKE